MELIEFTEVFAGTLSQAPNLPVAIPKILSSPSMNIPAVVDVADIDGNYNGLLKVVGIVGLIVFVGVVIYQIRAKRQAKKMES